MRTRGGLAAKEPSWLTISHKESQALIEYPRLVQRVEKFESRIEFILRHARGLKRGLRYRVVQSEKLEYYDITYGCVDVLWLEDEATLCAYIDPMRLYST